jgi:RNA recognition motif-containing protein
MARKIYIANLATSVGPKSLRKAFSTWGKVDTLNIITDRATGRSKGIAFIEMSSDAEAEGAIKELNGASLGGQKIEVSAAKAHNAPTKLGAATQTHGPRDPRDDRW